MTQNIKDMISSEDTTLMGVLDQLQVVNNDQRITKVNSELLQLSKVVDDLNGRIGRNEVDIRNLQNDFTELQESIQRMVQRLDRVFGAIAAIFRVDVMYGYREDFKFSLIGELDNGVLNKSAIDSNDYRSLSSKEELFQAGILEKIKLIDSQSLFKQHEGESPSTHLSTTCPRNKS